MLTPDDEASTVHRVVSGVPQCAASPVPVPVFSLHPPATLGQTVARPTPPAQQVQPRGAAGHLAVVSRIEDGKMVMIFPIDT